MEARLVEVQEAIRSMGVMLSKINSKTGTSKSAAIRLIKRRIEQLTWLSKKIEVLEELISQVTDRSLLNEVSILNILAGFLVQEELIMKKISEFKNDLAKKARLNLFEQEIKPIKEKLKIWSKYDKKVKKLIEAFDEKEEDLRDHAKRVVREMRYNLRPGLPITDFDQSKFKEIGLEEAYDNLRKDFDKVKPSKIVITIPDAITIQQLFDIAGYYFAISLKALFIRLGSVLEFLKEPINKHNSIIKRLNDNDFLSVVKDLQETNLKIGSLLKEKTKNIGLGLKDPLEKFKNLKY